MEICKSRGCLGIPQSGKIYCDECIESLKAMGLL